MKFYAVLVSFVAFVQLVAAGQYVYDYGSEYGVVIYTKSDSIGLLNYVTHVDIPEFPYKTITYVRVTVNSISPPKVDYDENHRRVTISYNFPQIPASTYEILVKGV